MPPSPLVWTLPPADRNRTLQEVLRQKLHISNRKAKALLDARDVLVNGKRVWMARHRLQPGDQIHVRLPSSSPAGHPPPRLDILHRDAHLLAVNKPPGRVSDRDPKSVEARLRAQLNLPHLRALHRLDKDTSGVMLLTPRPEDRAPYIERFKSHDIRKIYCALVRGVPDQPRLTLRTRLDGKEALTRVTLLHRTGAYSLLRCEIPTGRTHQIRRHLLQKNLVIVGERQYAQSIPAPPIEHGVPRQMLHALEVHLTCPFTDAPLHLHAPLPHDFRDALRTFHLPPPHP